MNKYKIVFVEKRYNFSLLYFYIFFICNFAVTRLYLEQFYLTDSWFLCRAFYSIFYNYFRSAVNLIYTTLTSSSTRLFIKQTILNISHFNNKVALSVTTYIFNNIRLVAVFNSLIYIILTTFPEIKRKRLFRNLSPYLPSVPKTSNASWFTSTNYLKFMVYISIYVFYFIIKLNFGHGWSQPLNSPFYIPT